jgi:hypothetical protein
MNAKMNADHKLTLNVRSSPAGHEIADDASKYPPAEPGALGCEALKAADRGRRRGPGFKCHLKVASAPQIHHLLQAHVLLFLVLDVLSYRLLVPSHG